MYILVDCQERQEGQVKRWTVGRVVEAGVVAWSKGWMVGLAKRRWSGEIQARKERVES